MSKAAHDNKIYENLKLGSITFGVILILILGSYFYYKSDEVVVEYNDVLKDQDYFEGDKNNAILVVEYIDLECQWCKLYHRELQTIKETYINKGVTFVYRSFPLAYIHKKAQAEALALECAGILGGVKAYLRYMDHVYYHTKSEDSLDLDILPVIAKDVGLNVTDFNSCRMATSTKDLVNIQVAEGLSHDVKQTPTYVVFFNNQIVIRATHPKQLTRTLDYLVGTQE